MAREVCAPDATPLAAEVFVCYSRDDRQVATALADALVESGLSFWWDSDLRPGDDFDASIQAVLATTKVVVAVLSHSSLASEWVMWELAQARRDGIRIVPLLTGGVEPHDVPSPFSLLHAVTVPAGPVQPGAFDEIAAELRTIVEELPPREAASSAEGARQHDARRRLAVAATAMARRANEIKARNRQVTREHSISFTEEAGGPGFQPSTSISMSAGLVRLLEGLDISFGFTSAQTGGLYLVGRHPKGGLSVHRAAYPGATGISLAGDSLVIATSTHIHRLENSLRTGQLGEATFSRSYVPRTSHFTGPLDIHDVGVLGDSGVLFVNTRFNCLARVSRTDSFKKVWVPHFISQIEDGDRCHLNGLAMRRGKPAYVTAASSSDTVDGWRGDRSEGGVVVDIMRDEIICAGLSMPHSPRFVDDTLWILNSGRGELGVVEPAGSARGSFRAVASVPGYARGLAFHRHYAFVGVSHPRYDDGGLELGEAGPWCGIRIVDTGSGETIHWLRIDHGVHEIYDVVVLPSVRCARSMGPAGHDALDVMTMEE